MIDSCKLTLQPDAAGHWQCLDNCNRSSVSDTHVLFFSELQVSGFSISQLIQAISQRTTLEPCLNLRSYNILNAQVFNQKVLILAYTSQAPFLTIYDLNTNEYKYSGVVRTHMFTGESCSRCLSAPGSLVMLNDYIIFSFSRNSPLFACEMNKISDVDSFLQLNCSGICTPIIDKHQLWVFEKGFLYIYSASNLLRSISKQDIGTYKVYESSLKEFILPPIVIERCMRIPVVNHRDCYEKIVIGLTNKYCFEIDVEKKQLTLLTPLVARESSSSGCYGSTTQFLFYFRETMSNKFTMHSLRFTLGSDIFNTYGLPVGYQLYMFEDKQHHHKSKGSLLSFKDLVREAAIDRRLHEAIDACRPDSNVSMTTTQKISFLRNVIRRVAKEYVCNQGVSVLNETEMEQNLRKLLHRYAERKIRKPRRIDHHAQTKEIYIGSSDSKTSKSDQTVSTYIVARTYTSEELELARHSYKRLLFCSSNDICGVCLTHNTSSCTHLLTPEPAIWYSTVNSCNMFMHAGINFLMVLCQHNLYVYLL